MLGGPDLVYGLCQGYGLRQSKTEMRLNPNRVFEFQDDKFISKSY